MVRNNQKGSFLAAGIALAAILASLPLACCGGLFLLGLSAPTLQQAAAPPITPAELVSVPTLPTRNEAPAPKPTPATRTAPWKPTAGVKAIMRLPTDPEGQFLVGKTLDGAKEISVMSALGDKDGLAKMALDGRALVVTKWVRVRILDVQGDYVQAEQIKDDQPGKTCWAATTFFEDDRSTGQ